MKRSHTTVVRGDAAQKLQVVQLPNFERRPINYFRDILMDDDCDANPTSSDANTPAKIEEMLHTEHERWETEHCIIVEERFQAGVRQGREECATETKHALELLQEYARLLQAEKQELAERTEKYGVELAFALAKKIIEAELGTRPEAVADVARAAIRQVLDSNQVRLKVNPDDLSFLRSVRDELAQMLDSSAQLEIKSDNTVERGGCMVETEHGLLDARVSSQLDTLKTQLANAKPDQEAQ